MNDLLRQVFCIEEETGKYRVSLTKTGAVLQGVGVGALGAAGTLLASGYHKSAVACGGIGSALTGFGNALIGIGKRNAMK